MIKTEQLYKNLKASQAEKGYYFNKDKDLVFELLDALIQNMDRYGYMACPCRLACGVKEADKDIVCPCDYRAPDVEEFGACYCGLYVSEALNNKEIESQFIPERRPPEKIL